MPKEEKREKLPITAEDKREAANNSLEDRVDEASWESFPASDPPAVTPRKKERK